MRPGTTLTLHELYWEYIGIISPKYKQFLINETLKQYESR